MAKFDQNTIIGLALTDLGSLAAHMKDKMNVMGSIYSSLFTNVIIYTGAAENKALKS